MVAIKLANFAFVRKVAHEYLRHAQKSVVQVPQYPRRLIARKILEGSIYHGFGKDRKVLRALTLITNPAYLDKAGGILAVEAYHAGLIRTVLFANGKKGETEAISNLRATLDGTAGTVNVDDHGVGDLSEPSITNASNRHNGALLGGFPTDTPPGDNAIAYDRTTRQVLNIVYGSPNASSGLFFPKGLNGIITS